MECKLVSYIYPSTVSAVSCGDEGAGKFMTGVDFGSPLRSAAAP